MVLDPFRLMLLLVDATEAFGEVKTEDSVLFE